MISSYLDEKDNATVVVVRPNISMSWRANMGLIAALMSLSLLLSSVFLIRGQWLVLLFIALQGIVLFFSTYQLFLRLSRQEVITISRDHLVLELGRKFPEKRHVFLRAWLKLKFVQSDNPLDVGHLWLQYHGAKTWLGEDLGRDEKRLLYLELQRLL